MSTISFTVHALSCELLVTQSVTRRKKKGHSVPCLMLFKNNKIEFFSSKLTDYLSVILFCTCPRHMVLDATVVVPC